MTRDEAKMLIATMEVTYPNFHPADRSFTVNVWHTMLQEYDYSQVQMAFKKFVLNDTKGFAPSIGQLVGKMQEITEGEDIEELKVWSMVSKAICNSGYHAQEEFNKLPPIVQRVVHSPDNLKEWALMETDKVDTIIQSHVIRNYREIAKAEKEEAKLPPRFKELIKAQRKTPDRFVAKKQPVLEKHFPEKAAITPSQESARRKQLEELREKFLGTVVKGGEISGRTETE